MPVAEKCEIIRPLLSVYVDKEATADEAARVEAHRDACDRCASALAFLQLSHAALSRPLEVPIPSALSARIAAATYERPTISQRIAVFLRPVPTRLALGTAAVAAIVAVAVLRSPEAARPPAPVATVETGPASSPHDPSPSGESPKENTVARTDAPAKPTVVDAEPAAPPVAQTPPGARRLAQKPDEKPGETRNNTRVAKITPEAPAPRVAANQAGPSITPVPEETPRAQNTPATEPETGSPVTAPPPVSLPERVAVTPTPPPAPSVTEPKPAHVAFEEAGAVNLKTGQVRLNVSRSMPPGTIPVTFTRSSLRNAAYNPTPSGYGLGDSPPARANLVDDGENDGK